MILLMRSQITGPSDVSIGSEFCYIDIGTRALRKLNARRQVLVNIRKHDSTLDALHYSDSGVKWFDLVAPPSELMGEARWLWDTDKSILQRFKGESLLENFAYNETVIHRDGVRWVAQQVDGEHIYESPCVPWREIQKVVES